jgi:transposase
MGDAPCRGWRRLRCPETGRQSARRARSFAGFRDDADAKRALGIAAMSAAHGKSTCLSARFRRIPSGHGHSKALVATEHSIVTAVCHILSNGDYYRDVGSYCCTKHSSDRGIRRKIKDLEAAG